MSLSHGLIPRQAPLPEPSEHVRGRGGPLVERRRSTADERQVLVDPTAAGRALRERAASVPAQVASATGLDLKALETPKRTLETVTARVEGGHQETNDRETTP
jgi:hypothetical protein